MNQERSMRIRIQWIKNLNTLTGKKNFAIRERWSKVSDHKLCKKNLFCCQKKHVTWISVRMERLDLKKALGKLIE